MTVIAVPCRIALKLKTTLILLATVTVSSLVAGGVSPAMAITYGTADNVHTNVGAVIFDQLSPAYFPGSPGDRFRPWWCSGTLVSARIVLTAGHCPLLAAQGDGVLPNDLPASKIHVSFAAADILDSRAWRGVKAYVIAPGFLATGTTPDVAAIILKAPVTDITPQPLPPAGLLDTLSPQQLRDATFTVVGYGMDENFLHPGDRRSGTAAYKQFYQGYLSLSPQPAGVCYMDSGGPAFLSLGGKDYMVGAVSRVKYADCSGEFREQRLDAPDALSFLQPMIGG